jgi:hypothetical protein
MGSASALTFTPAPLPATGQGLNPGSRDTRWQIVAAPSDFTLPEPLGYNAFIVGNSIAAGSTLTVDGITYQSISPSSDGDTGISFGDRHWIFSHEFVAPETGTYRYNFQASADNGLTVYLNGMVDSTDPFMPTIIGGTLIGEVPGFSQTYTINKIVNLNAGVNTLYSVLYDYGPPASFIIAAPPTDVPAPLPLLGATTALAVSRRLKNRFRQVEYSPTAIPHPHHAAAECPSSRSASATRSR